MYLALQKLGTATMRDLILTTGLSTAGAYRVMRLLEERRVVTSEAINRKQKVFAPVSTDVLADKIASQKRSLGRLEARMRSARLSSQRRSADSGTVDIVDDIDEIRDLYMAIPLGFRSEGNFLCFGSIDHLWEVLGFCYGMSEERNFIADRLRYGVAVNILSPKCDFLRQMTERDSLERRAMRIAPAIPLQKDLMILGEKTGFVFVTDKEHPRCLVVRRPEILSLYRSAFDAHWRSAISQ
jgi:hypothetical protein